MNNYTNIVSLKDNIMPFNENFNALSQKLVKSQKKLKETLSNLDSDSIDIDIKTNWLGSVKKSSLQKNFEDVYSNLSYYISECGKALQNTNDYLSSALELIKLLALAEKGLYEQLDDQVVSNNELKSILLDWFKQQGIKDEDIKDLIETSFQRAYTLRDRLNAFRKEYHENINKCVERINAFENRHTSLDNEIADYKRDAKTELQNIIENNKQSFEALYKERYSTIDNLATNNLTNLKKFVEDSYDRLKNANDKISDYLSSIDDAFTKISNKEKEFNSLAETNYNKLSQIKNDAEKGIKEFVTVKENELVEKITSSYDELSNSLAKKGAETQDKIEEIKRSIEKSIDEAISSFDINIQEYNKTLEVLKTSLKDEFQNQIKEQAEKFEKEKMNFMSSFKKKIIWTFIGSATISIIVTYLITIFGI